GRADALFLLPPKGRAPVGEMRYYVGTRADRVSPPPAPAPPGARLSVLGGRPPAAKGRPAGLQRTADHDDGPAPRADGTGVRDGAALITLASETGLAKTEVPRLVDVVAKAYRAKWNTSTQEQAWMLLAARALAEEAGNAVLSVNGAPHKGQLVRPVTPANVKDGALVITNDGDAPIDAVVSVVGAAMTPEPAVSKGFTIERAYYTLDGKKVDLATATGGQATLQQNERLVAVLKVASADTGGRILVVDRLPAGLEIENPRLVDSGDIKTLDWLNT